MKEFQQSLIFTQSILNKHTITEEEEEKIDELREKIAELKKEDILRLISFEASLIKVDHTRIPGPSDSCYPKFSSGITRCATPDPGSENSIKAYQSKGGLLSYNLLPENFNIALSFHLIKSNSDQADLPLDVLRNQLRVLNDAFSKLRVNFYIDSLDITVKSRWSKCWPDPNNRGTRSLYREMAISLQRAQRKNCIDIYVNQNEKVLGISNFPWTENYGREFDNIVISYSSLPGYVNNNIMMEGKTLVHEMGHFFGLFHTFHDPGNNRNCYDDHYNGCSGIGDRIDDTPPQKICLTKTGYCQNGSPFLEVSDEALPNCDICDTCPGDGPDPIDNYMGYNTDKHLKKFTNEQINRMQNFLFMDRRYLIKGQL